MKTENEVRDELIEMCNKTSQTAVAKELQLSIGFIHDVIRGRRSISKTLANKMGYRIETTRTIDRKYFSLGNGKKSLDNTQKQA